MMRSATPSLSILALTLALIVALFLTPSACEHKPSTTPAETRTKLAQARSSLKTQLVARDEKNEPAPPPPAERLKLVQYDSPAGKLNAYLSIVPQGGKKHPAIVWITGGDCNSIGDVWSRAARSNDQTASAYREGGIITMYPALRGGNGGPGKREGWLGEVDDVLAAADFLAKQEGVDAQRVYLGGHSTGGTLVLIAAESSDRFRAVFAFGPVADVSDYGDEYLPFNASDKRELEVRSPIHWLGAVQTPTFVIEGTASGTSNILSLKEMERAAHGDPVHFVPVQGVDHFGVLYPMNRLIVGKILLDTDAACGISFSKEEVEQAVKR